MVELALGTVQLGMDYGVTNEWGAPSQQQAMQVLSEFTQDGGCWLDTAPAYGQSESVIGHYRSQTDKPIKLCSKSPHLNPDDSVADMIAKLDQSLDASLKKLQTGSLDIYLLHQPWLLVHSAIDPIVAWMRVQQRAGTIGQIGASIYRPEDLDGWPASHHWLQWVQLPSNLLDQSAWRLGLLERLRARGVKIQVRSVFLQGLLLNPMLAQVELSSEQVRGLSHRLALANALGFSAMDLALGYVKQLPVDQVVVGVDRVEQLQDIKRRWALAPTDVEWQQFQSTDEYLINPSTWVLLERHEH